MAYGLAASIPAEAGPEPNRREYTVGTGLANLRPLKGTGRRWARPSPPLSDNPPMVLDSQPSGLRGSQFVAKREQDARDCRSHPPGLPVPDGGWWRYLPAR
jgi:hypothetical protein